MKIGCGTVVFRKFELERALDAIRKIGFEYFETQAVGPWCPHVNVEKDDPEFLVKLKNQFGFKEITGQTPLWHLNYIRLRSAKALLKSGKENITETALKCGFNDASYFCKLYKKYFGKSPKQDCKIK